MAFFSFYCFNDPLIPPTWVSLCIAKKKTNKKKGAQSNDAYKAISQQTGNTSSDTLKEKDGKNQQQPWLGHSISDRKS